MNCAAVPTGVSLGPAVRLRGALCCAHCARLQILHQCFRQITVPVCGSILRDWHQRISASPTADLQLHYLTLLVTALALAHQTLQKASKATYTHLLRLQP